MKKKMNLLCYSHAEFNEMMKNKGWNNDLPGNVVTISICSVTPTEYDLPHWFSDEVINNINVDFEDCGPYWMDEDIYDKAYLDFCNGISQSNHALIDASNRVFDTYKTVNGEMARIHAMSFLDAYRVVKLIHNARVDPKIDTIMVHCSAGVSRSQGVVRYCLDVYGNDVEFTTRADNPCITPNSHIVRTLKRAWQTYDYN